MPDAIRIRSAVPADARSIASINVTCWQTAYAGILDPAILAARSVDEAAGRWESYLAQPDGDLIILVAEQAGTVLGFTSGSAQRDETLRAEGYSGEITALYVHPSAQRRGSGAALLRALAAAFLAAGHDRATLWVLEENAAARRFYESVGGHALPHRKIEPRLGDAAEIAYAWPALTTLAAPSPILQGESQ